MKHSVKYSVIFSHFKFIVSYLFLLKYFKILEFRVSYASWKIAFVNLYGIKHSS